MEVFRVSTYYKAPHGLTIENMAAACPTGESQSPQTCGLNVDSTANNIQMLS